MRISYDPSKNERNIHERDLSFDRAEQFEFETALIHEDQRKEYGETRYVAIGHLEGRVRVLCFCETDDGIRVFSFRKANSRKAKRYAEVQSSS